MKTKTMAVAALALAACTLAACGNDKPSKDNLKKGIDAYFQAHPQKACWLVDNAGSVTFPLVTPMNTLDKTALGVIDGLSRMRLVTAKTLQMTNAEMPYLALNIDLTPEGKSKGIWDPKVGGVCLGQKEVVEVTNWTEPGNNLGVDHSSQVNFTWQYGMPSWADRSKFPMLPGGAKPVTSDALEQQTHNGWQMM